MYLSSISKYICVLACTFLFISCANNDNHSHDGDRKATNTTFAKQKKDTNEVVDTTKVTKGGEKNTDDYNGIYRLAKQHDCGLKIAISESRYKLKTTERKKSGKLIVSKENGEVHFRFKGTSGDNPKKEIQGSYLDESILIQNYGNAMNRYVRFNECESKYLKLEKTK